ncbi:hypothetical protein ACR8AL_12495 [Clavibacter sepedonicus]|uniref:Integral membrane protein n=1 Tax=Clavibacter sepedonicus TaxID=31964 RepID=B0RFY6_CLASE|nr:MULTISPECIES: hypothetical protein [Clavibacter]MBD5382314.1 hypothetical protein [Clavibacter sp.]OQJ46881.1 hypothetical protein B5P19_00255 [Clavibacter sepedonicus]OQJ55068.1 hypothetical protein B5P20_13945 [Clavibacter sepedonicus]UUK64671.1 hypothetical protein LRE50_10255 [Clavibacter sepedonicus]CAQ01123.1 putative integral membrane protein [Clavibacter sepedonicus]
MTADDTTADRSTAASDDPGHGRRELAAVGARALASWTAEVITRRRLLVAVGVALVTGTALALLLRPVFARADGEDRATSAAVLIGLVVGSAAGVVPVSVWLTRAISRHPSIVGTHPAWRDAALLDRSVDARGRVTLAAGTAERVATESRRAIASSAMPVPGAALLAVIALIGIPFFLFTGGGGTLAWFLPVYLLMSASTLATQCPAAGRMALLRDAADAELALPEPERTQAPPVEPPHGTRLP